MAKLVHAEHTARRAEIEIAMRTGRMQSSREIEGGARPPRRRADWSPAPVLLLAMPRGTAAARLRGYLESHGLGVTYVASGEEAINVLDAAPVEVLITALRAPRIQGLNLLAAARERNPEVGAVMIIAPGEEESATRALARGVVEFQVPPVNHAKVLAAVLRIQERQRTLDELAEARRRLDERFGIPGLIGRSAAIARVRALLVEIAPLDAHVLLRGERGTGKDFVVNILHRNSPRRNGPFVKVDCAALAPRLLARELFGAPGRRAERRRAGRVELAADGSLYLDEIAAVPHGLQARLSDLLRTGQHRPGLEAAPVELSLRLLASTTADPQTLLDRGDLDESFFGLLAETQIELPPLRHRRRDIPLLARHFLSLSAEERGRTLRFEALALSRLAHYAWPGNVRELRNLVEELADTVGARAEIREADLPEEIREARGSEGGFRVPLGTPLAEVERRMILASLQFCGGNRERAARMLGIGVRTLYRKLRSFDAGESRRRGGR